MRRIDSRAGLNGCTFALGGCGADSLEPSVDRYVSTGSLEYWPDLAQGIRNGLFGSCSRNAVAMRNENGIEFLSVSII